MLRLFSCSHYEVSNRNLINNELGMRNLKTNEPPFYISWLQAWVGFKKYFCMGRVEVYRLLLVMHGLNKVIGRGKEKEYRMHSVWYRVWEQSVCVVQISYMSSYYELFLEELHVWNLCLKYCNNVAVTQQLTIIIIMMCRGYSCT